MGAFWSFFLVTCAHIVRVIFTPPGVPTRDPQLPHKQLSSQDVSPNLRSKASSAAMTSLRDLLCASLSLRGCEGRPWKRRSLRRKPRPFKDNTTHTICRMSLINISIRIHVILFISSSTKQGKNASCGPEKEIGLAFRDSPAKENPHNSEALIPASTTNVRQSRPAFPK